MNPFQKALLEYSVSRDTRPKRVQEYFDHVGYPYSAIANWCGIFIANCIDKEFWPENPQIARNWLKVGYEVDNPQMGDIAVLWRENRRSWKGHVGFFLKKEPGRVFLFGGNQMGGKACFSSYSEDKVLGYRRLDTIPW